MSDLDDTLSASSDNNSDSDTEIVSYPKAVLLCKGKAQFGDRKLNLSEPIKIGRAVGKFKPSFSNGIFDCKVLSRNHALLYYKNNKFYLQDTGSSNGTFVNSVRLSNSNETSSPKEIFSGDLVQFGVDVTESVKYVTIPCIAATLKLYHANGSEAKATEGIFFKGCNSHMMYFNAVELKDWIQEARQREEILRNKLHTLSTMMERAQRSSEHSWKAMVEEDILLSRIESLQMKLKSLLDSDHNRPDEVILHLWKEVMNLQEERERYETKAKEAIQKALQEKLLVISKNYELQVALNCSEEQRDHYKEACDSLLEEMKKLAEEHDAQFKELQEMQDKYRLLAKAFEDISSDLKSTEAKSSEGESDRSKAKILPEANGIGEEDGEENHPEREVKGCHEEDGKNRFLEEKSFNELNLTGSDSFDEYNNTIVNNEDMIINHLLSTATVKPNGRIHQAKSTTLNSEEKPSRKSITLQAFINSSESEIATILASLDPTVNEPNEPTSPSSSSSDSPLESTDSSGEQLNDFDMETLAHSNSISKSPISLPLPSLESETSAELPADDHSNGNSSELITTTTTSRTTSKEKLSSSSPARLEAWTFLFICCIIVKIITWINQGKLIFQNFFE